ncbi:MAG TPA: Spy/CpxP family protein refolding chaperone [Bradyrhizobium sp.]|nr:Spy/CpxP family protein refolding chaperone [Bradyrhizobium sp.]
MRNFWIAAVAALAIAGSTAVYAQHHRHFGQTRMAPEDRAAYVDARIAAVHAGLRLNADQERLWPPVESAVREFAQLRIERANARMNAPADAPRPDPVTRLREHADVMAANASAMKKIADAADPLYKTLDEGQKRRLAVLTRMDGRFGGWRQRMMDRDDGPEHRGFRHDRFDRDDMPGGGGGDGGRL